MIPRVIQASLRKRTGPLTADLTLRPGLFGLGKIPAKLAPDAVTSLVCGFCSTGCGLRVHLRDGKPVNLDPNPTYPVNLGLACPKGWEGLAPLNSPERATTPYLRDPQTRQLQPTNWDDALQVFNLRFKALIDQHGPESVAFLSTGQICTEEMALLGSLFKFGMGGVHCDSNTRQCMATTHVAYKQSFGFDAPPYTYADFERSDVIVLIGSNLCVAHPIMWQRVLRNANAPEIIVIDPRRTETAQAATMHVPLRPKSDLQLLYGVAQALIAGGHLKREFIEAHTQGFDEFARFVEPYTEENVCAAAGLERELFRSLIAKIAAGRAVSFWWTMGVNQGHQATRTAQAIINLALMTGNIGRPGTGANSITGQCNAMGSRLFANASGLLGGRDFASSTHRNEVANLLSIPAELIPTTQSLAYDQIVERIGSGQIKGLWIIGTNSAHSWIDQENFKAAIGKLEFLVVQDMYHTTETAQLAHLILPAAGWGEKEGTFINSERRIGLAKKVSRAPGEALADFHIFRLVAHYWGCDRLFTEWTSPQAVFQILKRLSKGRPCDFSGIKDYRSLEECGGIQWPWPEESQGLPATERRLFEDGQFYHADGKAKFIFDAPTPAPEEPDNNYPLILLTGRGTSAQWHTLTRTNKSDILRKLSPAHLYVEMHPSDAHKLGLKHSATATMTSKRGQVTVRIFITSTVQPGQVFAPMHDPAINKLTFPAFDPWSRQPGYKYCAVRVDRAKESK